MITALIWLLVGFAWGVGCVWWLQHREPGPDWDDHPRHWR
jgi:hypothetical protein